jgi:hypothetical protein
MDSITVEDICQRPVQKAIQLAGVPIPGFFFSEISFHRWGKLAPVESSIYGDDKARERVN